MDFDFSDELKQLREQARKFLGGRDARGATRAVLEGRAGTTDLWPELAGLGWLGADLAEEHGGSRLGPLALCVLAEELGRAAAPVPFISTVCLFGAALQTLGSAAQQARWLPPLAEGAVLGTVAIAEQAGPLAPGRIAARVDAGRLSGIKLPVADAMEADVALVAAHAHGRCGWYLVELDAPGVARRPVPSLDRSRPQAEVRFDQVPCAPLPGATGATDWQDVRAVLERAAVPLAFEQLGCAQAALEMARDYALERYAFGRPIASFQAIKHKLADVYMNIELARSHAWYAAWALEANAPDLPLAAAAARVAASEAAWLATKENIQTHGGMGYTWDLDCHLYYRRAKHLSLVLGGVREWKTRLIDTLVPRTAAPAMPNTAAPHGAA